MILPPPWSPCRHPTWQWRAPCKPVKGRRAWVYVGFAPTDDGEPALWYSESATGLVRSHDTAEQAMATVAPDIAMAEAEIKPTACEILHDSGRYSATLINGASLVIESKAAKGQKRGVQLMDCAEWVDALRTALDATERDDLCRAIWRN